MKVQHGHYKFRNINSDTQKIEGDVICFNRTDSYNNYVYDCELHAHLKFKPHKLTAFLIEYDENKDIQVK